MTERGPGRSTRARIPLLPARLRWAGAAAVAAVILVASVVDPPASGPTPWGPFGVVRLDKYVHFVAYAGLAASVAYAVGDRPRLRVAAVAVLAAGAFGLGIEFVQAPLAARSFDLADALANVLGAGVAAVGWGSIRTRLQYRPVPDPLSSGSAEP